MLDQLERHAPHLPDYTELRLHNNYQSAIALIGGVVTANTTMKVGGVSARSYIDGAFGFASLPSLSDDDVPKAIAAARVNAELLQRKAMRTDGDLPANGVGTGVFDHRTHLEPLTSKQQIDLLKAVDDYLRTTYPDLLNIDVQLSTLAIEKSMVNSLGAATYSYVPRTILMVRLSYQAADGVVDLYDAFGGFGEPHDHLTNPEVLYPGLDHLYKELRDKADGVFASPGEHDVILDSAVAGILAHEAIGHTCEADLVIAGSVAGDMVGQMVASPLVTLVDQGGRGPGGQGGIAIDVDDEGTPCHDVTIIENGVLKGFLHNKETARTMGEAPTGNARAYQYDDEPLVRMRNTAIMPGDSKVDDMIASIEKGYYLKRSSNGQADSTSEFMFGINCGYEIVDGQVGRAIRDTTIAGVAFDMLKSITMVSDEMTWGKGGMCGKKQIIPVGMGGPAVKARIGIGGR